MTTTIRQATAAALATLPGLATECTAFVAPDNDGYAIVAYHAGVATVLQLTGSDATQAALVERAMDQADTLVIVPRASDLLPNGACVARRARSAS